MTRNIFLVICCVCIVATNSFAVRIESDDLSGEQANTSRPLSSHVSGDTEQKKQPSQLIVLPPTNNVEESLKRFLLQTVLERTPSQLGQCIIWFSAWGATDQMRALQQIVARRTLFHPIGPHRPFSSAGFYYTYPGESVEEMLINGVGRHHGSESRPDARSSLVDLYLAYQNELIAQDEQRTFFENTLRYSWQLHQLMKYNSAAVCAFADLAFTMDRDLVTRIGQAMIAFGLFQPPEAIEASNQETDHNNGAVVSDTDDS